MNLSGSAAPRSSQRALRYTRGVLRVLFADDHVTVAYDEAHGLVRYARTARPYATIDEMTASHEKLVAALPAFFSKTGLKLLVDVRQAPPRNDDAFEVQVTRLLVTFMQRFSAHAFLVKSAVGRLQTQRLARSRGEGAPSIFDDEAAALRHLGVP